MSNFSTVSVALNLPAPEIEALISGQMIVANSKTFIAPGRVFALYPSETVLSLSTEKLYRTGFLSTARAAIRDLNPQAATIKAWATCEFCQILDASTPLDAVSRLTIWTVEALREFLSLQQRIFLTYLRVYHFPEKRKFSTRSRNQFINLPQLITVHETAPVLENYIFTQRKQQLIELRPPNHPELEELLDALAEPTILQQSIKSFLGLPTTPFNPSHDSDIDWIGTIASVGNSSDGELFEKLVRKSFIKLGFKNSNSNPQASLDPDGCGGAGGLDFYCEKPYLVVGECKATKSESVSDGTPAQLIKLGYKHLQEQYEKCIKIVMAAGQLNAHAKRTAIGNKMNVIRPETLQRLVEMVAKYQGSVDLLVLEPCLREAPFGEEADDKVNQYVDKRWQELRVRSNLVQVVKELTKSDKKQLEVTRICDFYNFKYIGLESQGLWLGNELIYQLLIELSSPLTGYLGRIGLGDSNTDRFYYLRDLIVN